MKYLFFVGFFFVVQPLAGQNDSSITSLNEVVITAQRKTERKLLIPYTVQSVNRESLDGYSPRTTPEALLQLNGVLVQKTNHGGGSAFLRGLTGNQTLILVDGIRLNNSTFRYGPNQYLNTIDAYTISKIEVARGTGSVQYGTDALGGVIHIIPSEPSFSKDSSGWHGRVLSKYMTGDMEKTLRGELNISGENIAATGGLTYRSFGDLIGGDTTGRQSPSGYKEFATDAKIKFRLRDNVQVTFATQFLQQDHVPVYHKVVLEDFALNEFAVQRRVLNYGRLNIYGDRNIFKKVELIASWQQSIEGRNSRKNNSLILRTEKDMINTIGITYDIFSQITNSWSANSGIEFYYDIVNSTRSDINTQNNTESHKRGLYPDDSKYGNYSLYSLHHLEMRKWRFEVGVRFNTFDIRLSDSSLGEVRISPSAIVGNVAVLYCLNRRSSLYATLSTGYRAPNIDDMGTLGIVDFRYEVPARNLLPEKSSNAEIGYKVEWKRFSASANVYYLRLKDIITRIKMDGNTINGYPVYKKENVEESFIRGAEAEVDWLLISNLKISGGVSYTYGQNKTRNEAMRRIPPFNGKAMCTYRNQRLFSSIELMFSAKQVRLAQADKEDNRIPKDGTPGWSVMNVYGGYQLKKLKLSAGVQNIFNEDYRTHGSGINGYGRSGWLQIIFNF